MSIKQDRNGVRTAADLERKYDLSSIVGIKKAVKQSEEGINKTNAELENFMASTLSTIEDLENRIDGNVNTYFYSGVPTLTNMPASEWLTDTEKNTHLGDLYYDQDTGYAYRFALCDGVYKWLEIADSDVSEALALANLAKDTADGKRRVFTTTPFVPYDEGDLWLNNEELYVCITPSTTTYSASHFDKATKYTDDTSLNNFVNVTYTKQVNELNSKIDTKITTWYYSGVPTLSNAPANTWTTNDLKASHVGDLYYDKSSGHVYRFNYESNVYAWGQIIDSDLTQALALANSAKDTADNKRRIFTAQPTPPYDNGDLWFNNQEIYICQISKGESETYASNDFIIATKYTDDTLATQVGDNLEVVRGTVTTIQEGVDAFKIDIETTVKTINDLQEETIEAVERMSYTFGTNDLTIANSNDPVNARINNQGLKVYSYNTLKQITNHRGVGAEKLIVVGDSQLGNISITKATDENGEACTDINYLVSNIKTLADLE